MQDEHCISPHFHPFSNPNFQAGSYYLHSRTSQYFTPERSKKYFPQMPLENQYNQVSHFQVIAPLGRCANGLAPWTWRVRFKCDGAPNLTTLILMRPKGNRSRQSKTRLRLPAYSASITNDVRIEVHATSKVTGTSAFRFPPRPISAKNSSDARCKSTWNPLPGSHLSKHS